MVDELRELAPHGYVSLREYVDTRMDHMQHEQALSLAAQAAAIAKAEAANEARFDAVNEFRSQLGDQTRTFMPRLEVESKLASIDEKLVTLSGRLNARDDRSSGMGATIAWVIAGIGALSTMVTIIIATRQI